MVGTLQDSARARYDRHQIFHQITAQRNQLTPSNSQELLLDLDTFFNLSPFSELQSIKIPHGIPNPKVSAYIPIFGSICAHWLPHFWFFTTSFHVRNGEMPKVRNSVFPSPDAVPGQRFIDVQLEDALSNQDPQKKKTMEDRVDMIALHNLVANESKYFTRFNRKSQRWVARCECPSVLLWKDTGPATLVTLSVDGLLPTRSLAFPFVFGLVFSRVFTWFLYVFTFLLLFEVLPNRWHGSLDASSFVGMRRKYLKSTESSPPEVMICVYAVWMGIDADLNRDLVITDQKATANTSRKPQNHFYWHGWQIMAMDFLDLESFLFWLILIHPGKPDVQNSCGYLEAIFQTADQAFCHWAWWFFHVFPMLFLASDGSHLASPQAEAFTLCWSWAFGTLPSRHAATVCVIPGSWAVRLVAYHLPMNHRRYALFFWGRLSRRWSWPELSCTFIYFYHNLSSFIIFQLLFIQSS